MIFIPIINNIKETNQRKRPSNYQKVEEPINKPYTLNPSILFILNISNPPITIIIYKKIIIYLLIN